METETPYTSTLPPAPAVADGMNPPRGCARLAQTVATNEQSINLGGSILGALGTQRETLLNARQTLEASTERTQQSDNIVRQMIRRAQTTQAMKLGLIAFLVFLIVLLLFLKLSGAIGSMND